MQAALEAATFWREDVEAGAKETEMPACSSPGCGGVRPPLPQPEKVHYKGLTPLFTACLLRTIEMQTDLDLISYTDRLLDSACESNHVGNAEGKR